MQKLNDYHHGNLRSALIEKAIEMISIQGLDNVSLRSIARELSVSHAAPTRHFASKAALLTEIAKKGVRSLIASSGKNVIESSNPITKLQAFSEGYVMWAKVNKAHHLILRNHDVMRHADDELKKMLKDYSLIQQRLIKEAKNNGWHAKVSTRTILLQIMAMTSGLAMMVTDPIYESPLEQAVSDDEIKKVISEFFLP